MKIHLLSRLRRKDVVEYKETQYMAIINDETKSFDTKDELLNFIESYSKVNVIYSLNMFKVDLYNLLK